MEGNNHRLSAFPSTNIWPVSPTVQNHIQGDMGSFFHPQRTLKTCKNAFHNHVNSRFIAKGLLILMMSSSVATGLAHSKHIRRAVFRDKKSHDYRCVIRMTTYTWILVEYSVNAYKSFYLEIPAFFVYFPLYGCIPKFSQNAPINGRELTELHLLIGHHQPITQIDCHRYPIRSGDRITRLACGD